MLIRHLIRIVKRHRYLIAALISGCVVTGLIFLVATKPILPELTYVLMIIAGLLAMATLATFQRYLETLSYVEGSTASLQPDTTVKLEQLVKNLSTHVSVPYVEDSIEKISYTLDDVYLNLIITTPKGLLFGEEDIIITTTGKLPVLEDEEVADRIYRNTLQGKQKINEFVISIPHKGGSLESTSYMVANNYLHIVLYGSVALSADASNLRFKRITNENSE